MEDQTKNENVTKAYKEGYDRYLKDEAINTTSDHLWDSFPTIGDRRRGATDAERDVNFEAKVRLEVEQHKI